MSEQQLESLLHRVGDIVNDTSLWVLFAFAGGAGASVLALGILLRSNEAISRRVIIGTVLHGMAWGSAVFLMLYDQSDMGLPFTLGVSIFSGMGMASFVDIFLMLVKQRLGLSISITTARKEP